MDEKGSVTVILYPLLLKISQMYLYNEDFPEMVRHQIADCNCPHTEHSASNRYSSLDRASVPVLINLAAELSVNFLIWFAIIWAI